MPRVHVRTRTAGLAEGEDDLRPKSSIDLQRRSVLIAMGGSVLLTACGGSTTPVKRYGTEFTVSTSGSDANPGTPDMPFKTLEKARDAVRALIAKGVPAGGIAVWLRAGIYERSAPLELTAADSGSSAANPVDWLAYPGEEVRLIGGRKVPASAFSLVTSASPVWNRLDASAKGKVMQLDVKPWLGITANSSQADKEKAYGVLRQRGFGRTERSALELFVDAKPMWLARYPKVDATSAEQSIASETYTLYGTTSPNVAGVYTKYKVENGVSAYKRNVGGKDYMLHRTLASDATTGEAGWRWYLNTSDYPNDAVWWSDIKKADETPRHFYGNQHTQGILSGVDPANPFHGYLNTAAPVTANTFTCAGDRPSRWASAPDAWVDGFWSCEWEELHFPMTVNSGSRQITLQGAPSNLTLRPHQPWFAYNLLEELTQAGEFYLDRSTGMLYVWPPAGFNAASDVVISVLEAPIVKLTKADYVGFHNLTIEASRSMLIEVLGCKGFVGENLKLRNSGGGSVAINAYTSGNPAESRDSTEARLSRCQITNSGHTAVWLVGGNRKSLTASNNTIENCEISHYGRFQASGVMGVYVDGCGAIVRHNRIHHAPDRAINYGGNDHLFEFNEIDHVCLLCADAGAIYTGGWSTRGCKLRNNFIHHVVSAINGWMTHGLYVDDGGQGGWSEGNIFYEIGGAAHKFGGRDNLAFNNVIVKSGMALWLDDWGLDRANPVLTPGDPNQKPNWSQYLTDPNSGLLALGYRSAAWAARYPECAVIPNTWDAVIADADTWLTPRNCTFARNLIWQEAPVFIFRLDKAKKYLNAGSTVGTVNLRGQDPLFTDEANLNLKLKPNSPAFQISGFKDIPFDEIGIRG